MAALRILEPIFVTGATGFIGKRLVARLCDEGYAVRALVLPRERAPAEWSKRVEVFHGDVVQPTSFAAAMKGVKTVFHLAAVVGDWGRPEEHEAITVRGTDNVLTEAAREGARVLLASSVVVYGSAVARTVCDEQLEMGKPLGPYSKSKQQQERIAHRLEATHGLKVTIIRPTNVFGPGSGPWVDMAVDALRAGRLALVGGGRHDAALTYVDNVVDVFVRAAERPATIGRVYNASDESGVTWQRYFTDLAEAAGVPPPRSIPRAAAVVAACALEPGYRLLGKRERPPITREALNLVGSHLRVPTARARRELGYRPRVSYSEGMKAVAAYLQEKRA
jgi:nucleoside-diphosphate-sugar epimerase